MSRNITSVQFITHPTPKLSAATLVRCCNFSMCQVPFHPRQGSLKDLAGLKAGTCQLLHLTIFPSVAKVNDLKIYVAKLNVFLTVYHDLSYVLSTNLMHKSSLFV